MSKVTFETTGSFKRTYAYLKAVAEAIQFDFLDKYGKEGVEALQAVTPIDTGKTAESWYYEIERKNDTIQIIWKNRNLQNGINVALLLQYGHATRNGGYVAGIDYINPALKPVFDDILKRAEKEVVNL